MANWQGFTLTEKGLNLQAKINAGLATLNFTKSVLAVVVVIVV